MATIRRKQGNSLWLDIPGKSFNLVDSVWANWLGTYEVISDTGVTVLSGNLTKDATILGKFSLHLGATVMNTLTPGEYDLVFQFANTTVDYVQELNPQRLIISEQKI